jgi:hypothetical protein
MKSPSRIVSIGPKDSSLQVVWELSFADQ